MHTQTKLSVREIQESDINLITDYWLNSSPEYLRAMGADPDKMPARDYWITALRNQISQPYNEKQAYAIIWEIDDKAVGHCNVNKIKFGEEAYMHLHLWQSSLRNSGFGAELVKKSVPFFFKNLQLKRLYSEPFALNNAPNKTLPKAGFRFVKEYVTTPGYINFEQPVKLWQLSAEEF